MEVCPGGCDSFVRKNEERAVGVDPNRRLWTGAWWVSTAESVAGSDHIVVAGLSAELSCTESFEFEGTRKYIKHIIIGCVCCG